MFFNKKKKIIYAKMLEEQKQMDTREELLSLRAKLECNLGMTFSVYTSNTKYLVTLKKKQIAIESKWSGRFCVWRIVSQDVSEANHLKYDC